MSETPTEQVQSPSAAVAQLDASLRAACPDDVLELSSLGDSPAWTIVPAAIARVGARLRQAGYDHLELVSTVDRGEQIEIVYLLDSMLHRTDPRRLALRCLVPREAASLPTLCGVWRAADWFEREAFDLMGVTFTGHPDPRRILLPDQWQGHPLRKDYEYDSDTMVQEILDAELNNDDLAGTDGHAEHDGMVTEDLAVNMGPQHPSTHGVLRLRLRLDGEYVRECDPDIGFLHRAFEKLGELKTFTNGIPLTDRWDYLNAMGNNMVHCQAVEAAMSLEVPERVHWTRMLVLELNRVASHLVFIGTYGLDLGAGTPFLFTFRDRERILDMFELLCGARLTYNYLRIGGVAADLPRNFIADRVRPFLAYLPDRLAEIDQLLTGNQIFLERTKGVGIWPAELCVSYGLTGPLLRASGVARDVRRVYPYARYDQCEFDIPVGENGDCYDRYIVRVAEIRQSLRLLDQICAWFEANEETTRGQISAKVPRVIKPPAGEVYTCVETPRGELGLHLVCDGGENPYRYKIRRPSFVNLGLFGEVARDQKVADLIAILGTTDIVMGEVDG